MFGQEWLLLYSCFLILTPKWRHNNHGPDNLKYNWILPELSMTKDQNLAYQIKKTSLPSNLPDSRQIFPSFWTYLRTLLIVESLPNLELWLSHFVIG